MNDYQREVEELLLVRAKRAFATLTRVLEFLAHESSRQEVMNAKRELLMALDEYELMMLDRDEVKS